MSPPQYQLNGISYPAGNLYPKYSTRNPIARLLMSGFLSAFDELAGYPGVGDAHEIGCGEGYLTVRLAQKRRIAVRGCDLSEEAVAMGRETAAAMGLSIPFSVTNLYDLKPPVDAASLVICCEVIEHLDNPGAGLNVLAELARPWLLVSAPREPIWRAMNMARGKFLSEFGNTPGHLNHFTAREFVNFLSQRVQVIEVRKPLPWTMVLCRTY